MILVILITVKRNHQKNLLLRQEPNIHSEEVRCQAEFKSGQRKGQVCGAKICSESVTGKYCKRHLGNEKETISKGEKKIPRTSKKKVKNEDVSEKEDDFGDSTVVLEEDTNVDKIVEAIRRTNENLEEDLSAQSIIQLNGEIKSSVVLPKFGRN